MIRYNESGANVRKSKAQTCMKWPDTKPELWPSKALVYCDGNSSTGYQSEIFHTTYCFDPLNGAARGWTWLGPSACEACAQARSLFPRLANLDMDGIPCELLAKVVEISHSKADWGNMTVWVWSKQYGRPLLPSNKSFVPSPPCHHILKTTAERILLNL